jgi:hypothetical protein
MAARTRTAKNVEGVLRFDRNLLDDAPGITVGYLITWILVSTEYSISVPDAYHKLFDSGEYHKVGDTPPTIGILLCKKIDRFD